MSELPAAENPRDVPETRFGVWFQGTRVWRRYVVLDTLAALDRLIARPGARFPRILDAGCGHGFALAALDARYSPSEIVAIDADSRLLSRARSEAHACRARVEVRAADLAKLDAADAQFDLVLCHQTLHHVREQARVLAELRRVLRPGGVLLLAESCREFVTRLWVRAFFRHAMHAQHTAEEYAALVREAGFEIVAIATPDPWWSLRDLGVWDRLVRRRRPADAPHTLVCIAARRPA